MWMGLGGREVACRMQSFGMKVRVLVDGAGEDREGGGLQDAVIWQSLCVQGWFWLGGSQCGEVNVGKVVLICVGWKGQSLCDMGRHVRR